MFQWHTLLMADLINESTFHFPYRYTYEICNSVGSVSGSISLVVCNDNKEQQQSLLQSQPVSVEEFEKYVAISHANNDREFILQYEVCQNSESLISYHYQ